MDRDRAAGTGGPFPFRVTIFATIRVSDGTMIRPLLLCLALAGCAASGIAGDPITRMLQWPEVMAGNDIRRACGPGAPERWRFVYNGSYAEQVRVYEIEAGAVVARVFDRPNLALVGALEAQQVMRGIDSRVPITPEEMRRLVATWEGDLALAVRPVGHLRSDRFFWTTAACRDGRFTVAAFAYPADGASPFAFPEELARFDRTGRKVNPPRPVERDAGVLADYTPSRHGSDRAPRFLLRVTEGGIETGY
jgi:hypothetical protein